MEIKSEKIVDTDESLGNPYRGSIRVTAGSELILNDTTQGSISIEDGRVIINGIHQGSVNISSGSHLLNNGSLQGSINVEYEGSVENAQKAKLSGSLNVSGTLINYGLRSGTTSGNGDIIDKPGSEVKQPTIINGMNVYTSN